LSPRFRKAALRARFRMKRALISATLGLVLSILVAACGGSTSSGTNATPTTPTTSSTTNAPPSATPAPPVRRTVEIVVAGGVPRGGIARPRFPKGTRARVIVHTDAGTEVHLHGYDIERAVTPGTPVRIDFTATIPGRFELELHDPDVLLAEITVTS
jgi:hypothetical protein